MGPLKNRDSLLVLWGLTGIFFFSYIYVQSGRLADSLYGLGIYSLSWGGIFSMPTKGTRSWQKKFVKKVWRTMPAKVS